MLMIVIVPDTSHSCRVRLVKLTLSRTPVIETTAVIAPPKARVPHGVEANLVTPAHAIIARIPGTWRPIVGLPTLRRRRLREQDNAPTDLKRRTFAVRTCQQNMSLRRICTSSPLRASLKWKFCSLRRNQQVTSSTLVLEIVVVRLHVMS